MERVGVDVVGPFPTTGGRDHCRRPDSGDVQQVWSCGVHPQRPRQKLQPQTTMCERLGMHKTRTTPLHPQSDGLVERFNKTLGQQLAIVSTKHQCDWDKHLPMVLMACRSAVQDSTSCTPALLMLGREIRSPAEMAFGRPLDSPCSFGAGVCPETPGPPGDSPHLRQRAAAGVRQKRNYDVHTRGRHFVAGELVWVYSSLRKKGRCPKLDSHWVGPCSVMERVGEFVHRVQLPPRGRKVALHRDRLAPYRGASSPQTHNSPLWQ
ncbi:uncharacterized protein LOC110534325 [Oncorhynchus mykiss]|uniref:uncharacterized protein LOC110534325 n=1 Tax=Oncorhynchus mykiss TaxID=8022 RepID=UPI001877D61D|nr:uncharacterized protein LOC110534325 [Oncorhynchus mykiss]